MRRLRRWVKRLALLGVIAAVMLAIPILRTEFSCMGGPRTAASTYLPILAPEHRRNEVASYLTYPEWSIVHAYEDFAGVVRQGSESDFDYVTTVRSYWSSLCGVMGLATKRGVITSDYKAMLYIIGASFTAEMMVKGLYEQTIGRLTAWMRGAERTAEDQFALEVAEDYAAFLKQTPWYEYPFGATLVKFWTEVPWGSAVRSLERRVSLSMEFGVKAIYARLIAQLAGLSPTLLDLRSVVQGLDASDTAAEPRIRIIETRADGSSIIETPRYRAFTEILLGLAKRGRDVIEIAGNDDVLVTYLSSSDAKPLAGEGERLLTVPLQARPGWERRGVDVKVTALAALMRASAAAGVEFEHVYDY